MGITDIIILAFFVPSIIIGFRKGLVDQLISLSITLGGIWLSIRYSDTVGEWIGGVFSISDSFWLKAASFILIFAATALILHLLGSFIQKILKLTMMGGVNRIFGALLGFVKAAFLIGILAYFVNAANELAGFIPADKLAESRFFTPLVEFAKTLFPLLKGLF